MQFLLLLFTLLFAVLSVVPLLSEKYDHKRNR